MWEKSPRAGPFSPAFGRYEHFITRILPTGLIGARCLIIHPPVDLESKTARVDVVGL